jgi:aspartokinase-like uncharacterized kinase
MVRVIKVGGSLLTWPGLQAALPRWLNTLSPANNLLIFGGGECVEAMRELDALWNLDSTAMHWRCVRLLDATFEIAQELWPQWEVFSADSLAQGDTRKENPGSHPQALSFPFDTAHRDTAERLQHYLSESHPKSHRTVIVHIASLYTRHVHALPSNWATTTDSIAAYLARRLKAPELILLKSTTPSSDVSASEAAESGLVDAAFPTIVPRDCRILTVDLTSNTWQANHIQTST